MWPDRVSNPRLLTYESGALPTALRGPACYNGKVPDISDCNGNIHMYCIDITGTDGHIGMTISSLMTIAEKNTLSYRPVTFGVGM